MKHLKEHIYYSDLYDQHTVEQCRRAERPLNEDDIGPIDLGEKKYTKEQAVHLHKMAKNFYLHIVKGERYANKAKTIREWMDADRNRDDLLENAHAPEGIRCLTCRNLVKPNFKQLWMQMDKPDRVLFMYECPNKCLPMRSFFSDGEEWRVKPHLCPRCDGAFDEKVEDDKKKCVITRTCPKCGHVEVDEHEWSTPKEEEFDPKFAIDRDRFCMTDEEGREYEQSKYNMEQLGKLMEQFKKQEEEWAERLKENPKGFILEGRGRNCAICWESSQDDGSWYDQYGVKCLVCQKAIDEGEIPPELAKDKDSWYSKWDLERAFNLKSQTLRKWVKDGLLKSRTISHYGKGVHCEVFLLEDNKDFLPPKKMVESHSVSEKKDGKTWSTLHPWYHFVDPLKHLKDYKIIEHMRVVPPEEVAAREAEEKRKWEEKRAWRAAHPRKQVRRKKKSENETDKNTPKESR